MENETLTACLMSYLFRTIQRDATSVEETARSATEIQGAHPAIDAGEMQISLLTEALVQDPQQISGLAPELIVQGDQLAPTGDPPVQQDLLVAPGGELSVQQDLLVAPVGEPSVQQDLVRLQQSPIRIFEEAAPIGITAQEQNRALLEESLIEDARRVVRETPENRLPRNPTPAAREEEPAAVIPERDRPTGVRTKKLLNIELLN